MAKLKELYDEKYVINFVDICASFDPSKTNKYVPYMLKLLEGYIADVRKDYETTTLLQIKELVCDFHDLAERNQIENKDIYSYESFEVLDRIVQEGKSKITESQIKKKETNVLFENDEFLIVRPLSIRSSRLYGATTKWCTASDRHDFESHFERYAGNGILVYFINKKGDPKFDRMAKVAFHNETDFNNSSNITIWDVEDKQLSTSDMTNLIGRTIPFNVYEVIQNELYSKTKINIIKS